MGIQRRVVTALVVMLMGFLTAAPTRAWTPVSTSTVSPALGYQEPVTTGLTGLNVYWRKGSGPESKLPLAPTKSTGGGLVVNNHSLQVPLAACTKDTISVQMTAVINGQETPRSNTASVVVDRTLEAGCVPPPPPPPPVGCTISATPAVVNFARVIGGPVPAPQTVTVVTSDGSRFQTNDTGFYDASLACYAGVGNSCASGGSTTITPSADSFAAGLYSYPLTITAGPGCPAVTVPVNLTVGAVTPPPVLFTLGVGIVGSGTVAGAGTGTFPSGATVTLTPTAAAGHAFTGWSGACTGLGTCVVQMTANKTVTATFAPVAATTYTLTTSVVGRGSVSASPGPGVGGTYSSGQVVTLLATPASDSTFVGWSGACTGTGTCSVVMSAAKSVTATFTSIIVIPPVGVPTAPLIIKQCTWSVAAAPPAGTGWTMQLQNNGVNLGTAKTSAPYQQTVTVVAGSGNLTARWTKPGVTTQTSAPVPYVCAP